MPLKITCAIQQYIERNSFQTYATLGRSSTRSGDALDLPGDILIDL